MRAKTFLPIRSLKGNEKVNMGRNVYSLIEKGTL